MWDQERGSPVAVGGGGGGGGANWAASSWVARLGRVSHGGWSHESENDLGAMVSDFLENGGSLGADCSRYSSDSDSAFSDLAHLADKISKCKRSVDQYESDLLQVVHSQILSINETNLQLGNPETCSESCIRFSLVKLLQSSGYNAAICSTKWQGFGKVPGGEHEFIDVINHHDGGSSERYIIDIDFRSHFEIARAVKPYNALLDSLPPVYVGPMTKLKQFLQTMVEAARFSLKQNSMPLPPWRSLAYLETKWQSTSQRELGPFQTSSTGTCPLRHEQCIVLLNRLKSCIQSEIRAEGLLIPSRNDNKRRFKDRSTP